ncbi:MAG: YeeE/YedE family protein [Bacillota bacterium]|nr:YeeE/YedE family protein [Bacillota bacterium]
MSILESHITNLDTHCDSDKGAHKQKANLPLTVISLGIIVSGFFFLGQTVSYTQAFLFLVTGVMGLTLYHAHFGFTSSFRHLIVSGRGIGIRAQMIMFIVANLLFLPLLLRGSILGHQVVGNVSPVGLSVLVGSILFGIGMQLGDGCASGTLYHTGGGDIRGILTIIGFIVGSVIGSKDFSWWMSTPNIGPVSFIQSFGALGGIFVSFILIGILFFIVYSVEKRRYGKVEPLLGNGMFKWETVMKGPWSWVVGGFVLAVGNFVLLLVSGKPWGVTSAFALWGAKIAQPLGIHVENWGYWQIPAKTADLHGSLFHNLETTDNIALMVGALLAAALAGKLPKRYFQNIPIQMIIGVLVGGVLMGYGARIAFGCNIGAYFSGISSFSLHGWEWFIGAIVGSYIGIALRPVCKLKNK